MSEVGMVDRGELRSVRGGSALTEPDAGPSGASRPGSCGARPRRRSRSKGAGTSRGDSIWDRFCERPGAILDGSNGDHACDHVNRWRTDVELLRRLGLGAYRFSISWPRVLPEGRGAVSAAGLDFYSRLVDGLLEAGITPYVTLYHWDLPQPLEDAGGWPVRATAEAFADYAELVAGHLGDRVRHWTTLNEPYCSAEYGYVEGRMAPGRQSRADGFAAAHHLLLGHGLAVERIRAASPSAEVALVLNLAPVYPASDRDDDVEAAHLPPPAVQPVVRRAGARLRQPRRDDARGRLGGRGDRATATSTAIAAPIDVLGVNYYTPRRRRRRPRRSSPTSRPVTGCGWEIYPQGLTEILQWLHRSYGFSRYLVTENGAAMNDVADAAGRVDDVDRIDYLRSHLLAVHDAIADGVPVEGYFVWSLLDNFEWAYGYSRRFGLIRVDYDTFARTPKASADWYAEVARTNTVS